MHSLHAHVAYTVILIIRIQRSIQNPSSEIGIILRKTSVGQGNDYKSVKQITPPLFAL